MLLFGSKTLSSRFSPLSPAFAIASSSYFYRLLSTSPSQDIPSPSLSSSRASDFAVGYLIKSCGLPSDKAARASRYLSHLKSPDKPDAVLRFLRQAGISEPHIKAAVLREPRLLCCNVEKFWQPRMAQLQDIGLSPSHISLLISICPNVFARTALREKIQFWLGIFNSIEELLGAVKNDIYLLSINLKTISANLSCLEEQCGLSASKIVHLIKLAPRFITSTTQSLKNRAKRAEELGVRCSSGMFVYALKVVTCVNQSNMDARINNLRSLGFSQEEVTSLVSKQPTVLTMSEDIMARKMQFLTKEAGCDNLHLVNNPSLLTFSIEKRLIPRNLVRKFLELKGFLVANKKLFVFMKQTDKQFMEKFILPYEPATPGLLRAYEDACAGNTRELEWFKSISS